MDGSFVGKAKMIIDATVPWKFKSLKRGSELPIFVRARLPNEHVPSYGSR